MIVSVVLLWNVLVCLCYAYDKGQAVTGRWRLSERFLLTVTLLCGGLGALVGARCFHHKTKKWYFVWAWWLGILNMLVLLSSYVFLANLL